MQVASLESELECRSVGNHLSEALQSPATAVDADKPPTNYSDPVTDDNFVAALADLVEQQANSEDSNALFRTACSAFLDMHKQLDAMKKHIDEIQDAERETPCWQTVHTNIQAVQSAEHQMGIMIAQASRNAVSNTVRNSTLEMETARLQLIVANRDEETTRLQKLVANREEELEARKEVFREGVQG